MIKLILSHFIGFKTVDTDFRNVSFSNTCTVRLNVSLNSCHATCIYNTIMQYMYKGQVY